MAEVEAAPQWHMLEALRNKVIFLRGVNSSGEWVGTVSVSPADFDIDTAGDEPVLELSVPKTLTVGEGDTIMAIILVIDNTDTSYDAADNKIRYPIVDVDGNGEYFPDGGSIDTTQFEVYLNDL